MTKSTVKVIGVHPLYRKDKAYPSIPMYKEELDTYITGQHIDPNDPTTSNNLTKNQMLGLDPLTTEQKRKFKYVINPGGYRPIHVRNMTSYDMTIVNGEPLNHKDYWEGNYVRNHVNIVASTKAQFKKGQHYFYVEDKEKEASDKMTLREKKFKAIELVRTNESPQKLTNIAIMLNYYSKVFNTNPNKVSFTVLQDLIYEECENNPENIIKCFNPDQELELHILKLVDRNIIQRRGDDFFDGTVFIGQGISSVKIFMDKADNKQTVNKWNGYLSDKKVIASQKEDNNAKNLADAMMALLTGDSNKLEHLKKSLEGSPEGSKLEEAIKLHSKSKVDDNSNTDAKTNSTGNKKR
jgi:hypothetical protein